MKRGAKKRGAILLSLAMVLSLIGVGPVGSKDALAAKKIQLAKTKITVAVGKTKKIKIKNIKKKQVKKLTVKSKNSKLAKAKASGKTAIKVTGKKKGSTKVTLNLKLKKKVGGKKAYKLTLKVTVKKSEPTPTTPAPTVEPTQDPRTPITLKTVELADMTYYIGQTPVPPLDASKTTVTPPEAATGGDVTYQWYMGSETGSEVELAGETSAQYTPDITKAGTFSVYYTAKFTPTEQYKKTYQESSATSNKATITVLEKVPITFDANGGAFGTGTNAKTELKKEYEWGKTLGTLPSESEMSPPQNATGGRDLLGWTKTKDAAFANVYSTTKATEATTYYAVWGTRPPDTSSYTPPSAQTPTNMTITLSGNGNLTCNASVTDGGTLSYRWYSISGNVEALLQDATSSVAGYSDVADAIGGGYKIKVEVTNSKDGYTSSIARVTYVFLKFERVSGITYAGGAIVSSDHGIIIAKPENSQITLDELPTATNDNTSATTKIWKTDNGAGTPLISAGTEYSTVTNSGVYKPSTTDADWTPST